MPHYSILGNPKYSLAMSKSSGDPVKALFSEQFIERLKDRDMVRTHMRALSTVAPKLFHALVGERDEYMVNKLNAEPGKRIVGVVGLGHLGATSMRSVHD